MSKNKGGRPKNCTHCRKTPCDCGRPTVMTDEVISKLEEAFSVGATDLQACFYAEISKESLYRYQKANPEFRERKEGLKNNLQFIAKNVLANSIETKKNEQDAKWLLERKEKKDYSTRTESTGADGEAIEKSLVVKYVD